MNTDMALEEWGVLDPKKTAMLMVKGNENLIARLGVKSGSAL